MPECELHVKPSSVSSMPVCWRSILYQRGVYPPEDFQQQKQYGLTMMVSTEPGIKKYLCSVLEQMSGERCTLRPFCPYGIMTYIQERMCIANIDSEHAPCRLAPHQQPSEDGSGHQQCCHQGSPGALDI